MPVSDPTSYIPRPGASPDETTALPPIEDERSPEPEPLPQPLPEPEPAPVGDGPSSGPLGDLRVEKPRTHPLTYAALALAALALIFSIAALGGDDGEEFRKVRIGDADCVIGEDEADDGDVLYCRAAGVPGR